MKVTIFRMSSECGGEGGVGRQAYKIAAYYRSQTSLDKGDKGIYFSLRLTKSDHLIALLCLCDFERNNLKKSFHLLLISSDKPFPGLPVIASAGFTRRQHRFALFSLKRATENRVTRSVFPKPQSHKKCYHVIRIF